MRGGLQTVFEEGLQPIRHSTSTRERKKKKYRGAAHTQERETTTTTLALMIFFFDPRSAKHARYLTRYLTTTKMLHLPAHTCIHTQADRSDRI